jgi:hypothetical protein
MNVKNISLKKIDLLNRIKFPVKIFHKIAREKKKKTNLALLVYAIRKALLTKESESDSILL